MWAVFNTALQSHAKDKGILLHKNADQSVLTQTGSQGVCGKANGSSAQSVYISNGIHALAQTGLELGMDRAAHVLGSALGLLPRNICCRDPMTSALKQAPKDIGIQAPPNKAQTQTALRCLCRTSGAALPPCQVDDVWGLRRIPAFWFTLNLPYNHLNELHRFRDATAACTTSFAKQTLSTPELVPSCNTETLPLLQDRCEWVLHHPDLVVQLHALRVEILVRDVMAHIIPYWLRFEFGKNGNPHAHGQCYVSGKVVALLESGQRAHCATAMVCQHLDSIRVLVQASTLKSLSAAICFHANSGVLPAPVQGRIEVDPHRPDLRNLFLSRNDPLLNNYEPHLLLANLGNIDWRALINLWSVLEYLTKYTAKAGEGSKHLGTVFREVLTNIHDWEQEDGVHDLWRRTIFKFYSRIIGDRDYSLFEAMHFCPGTLSNFGDVHSASVANYAPCKPASVVASSRDDESLISPS